MVAPKGMALQGAPGVGHAGSYSIGPKLEGRAYGLAASYVPIHQRKSQVDGASVMHTPRRLHAAYIQTTGSNTHQETVRAPALADCSTQPATTHGTS